MIEGRIAGLAAAAYLGFMDEKKCREAISCQKKALMSLRRGMFAPQNKGRKLMTTEEGIPLSEHLLKEGYVGDEEIGRFPGVRRSVGIHPVMECTQNIPCNPCQDACPHHCIRVGDDITALPQVDDTKKCVGCGLCVASCSGQAVFLLEENYAPGFAAVTIPYEFLPLPEKGEKGTGLGRRGEPLCEAEVVQVKTSGAFDKTNLVTLKIPEDMAMRVRFYRKEV